MLLAFVDVTQPDMWGWVVTRVFGDSEPNPMVATFGRLVVALGAKRDFVIVNNYDAAIAEALVAGGEAKIRTFTRVAHFIPRAHGRRGTRDHPHRRHPDSYELVTTRIVPPPRQLSRAGAPRDEDPGQPADAVMILRERLHTVGVLGMSGIHPLSLTKSIADPIYGLIRMTPEELIVMDHRVFQRLRSIKQLALLHYVFPSATHTRFEHSLGVMYVADSVLQALCFNSIASRSKILPYNGKNHGTAVDFSEVPEAILTQLFRITRLAAMVHDLGHGPLSHTFDAFAPHRDLIQSLLAQDGTLPDLKPLHDVLVQHDRKKDSLATPVSHEAMSCILFAWIWQETREQRARLPGFDAKLDPLVPLGIAAAILGDQRAFAVVRMHAPALAPWYRLINDIVASAPVDADRMDYMERDSRSCGVSYGLFDRERVLKSVLCYRDRDGDFRIGWKMSGLRAIEVFVQARFQMYAQIYYHKTNHAGEMMMEQIAHEAELLATPLFDSPHLAALVDEYCEIGDERFMHILCGKESKRLTPTKRMEYLANRVARRDLWKRVYESGDSITADRLLGALRALGMHESVERGEMKLKPTKGLEMGSALLERDETGHYATQQQRSWLDASPLMRTLEREEKKIARLFWTGNGGRGSEPLDRLRKTIGQIMSHAGLGEHGSNER